MQAELLDGEVLIWTGQPLRQVIFHHTDWYAIPFSLLWGSFAIFWELGVAGHVGTSAKGGPSVFMELWGIPFLVMGQYMIWGRFFYTAWKKGRTHYAVTTKRVLVLNSGGTRKLVSGYLSTLDSVTLTTRQDRIGTIEFSPEPDSKVSWGSSRRRNRGPQMDINLSRLAFYDVSEARVIYGLIQKERSAATDRSLSY